MRILSRVNALLKNECVKSGRWQSTSWLESAAGLRHAGVMQRFIVIGAALLVGAVSCFNDSTEALDKSTWTVDVFAESGDNVVYGTGAEILMTARLGVPPEAVGANDLNVVWTSSRSSDVLTLTGDQSADSGDVHALLRVTTPGKAQITAQALGQHQAFGFEVADPDPAQCRLSQEANQLVAGRESLWGTFLARDAKGRRLAGLPVAITLSDPDARVLPTPLFSGPTGYAYFAIAASRVGPITLKLAAGAVALERTITVVPAGVNVMLSTFTAEPQQQIANGSSSIRVTVNARDSAGNPIADLPVVFVCNVVGTKLATPRGVTDANGACSSELTSTRAQNVSLSVALTPPQASDVVLRQNGLIFVAP
jgi:hypothetical protein